MTEKANPNWPVMFNFLFKLIVVLLAGGFVYLGYDLFIRGVTGEASLVANAQDVGEQLINAAPGLFLAVGGIVIIVAALRK
jgi:hypothetical protein